MSTSTGWLWPGVWRVMSGPAQAASLAGASSWSWALKRARNLSPVAGSSAVQATRSPRRNSWRLWALRRCMASTFLLVSRLSVKASLLGRSPPNISGERNTLQSVISVYCSSRVKRLRRSSPRSARMPRRPNGSISASGKAPGWMCGAQRLHTSKCSFSCSQLSQKSPTVRHILTFAAMCLASAMGVSPGEVLNTILRPERSIARRIISTSGLW